MKTVVLLIMLAGIAVALPPPTCVKSTMVTDCTPAMNADDGCWACYRFSCQTHDVNTWQLCSTFCQNQYGSCEHTGTVVTSQTCYLSSNCPPNLPYALESDTDQYDFCYNKYCGPSGAQITCNSACPNGVTKNFSSNPIKQARWRQRFRARSRHLG